MAMDAVDVPSKWVCRLTSFLGHGSSKFGTGFVVNIPGSEKLSIMTAGHNIVDVKSGRASSIEVIFPNGLTFMATPDEYFASKAYEENTTDRSEDETSIFDYGLISVDKKKHLSSPELDPGGCAFSILTTDYEMLHMEVSVHGYRYGETQQTHNTSPLSRIDSNALYYFKKTVPGVSGGPVFVSKDGVYTAVGIHNYDSRASRLTYRMLLEMLGWVQDYKLRRCFELPKKNSKDLRFPGAYLQATNGSRPTIVARQDRNSPGYLRFVLADVPNAEKSKTQPQYVILPAHDQEDEGKPLHLLTLVQSNEEASLEFRETALAQRCNQIEIDNRGPKKILWFRRSKLGLVVEPSNRRSHCDHGCITQDQVVKVKASTKATGFIASNHQPSHNGAGDVPRPSSQSDLPPLYLAVINQDIQAVQKHLEQNSDPNVACRCGTSALSKAAENGDIKIADFLLKRGAQINTQNLDSESPEDLAQRNGHLNIISKFKAWRAQRIRLLTQEAAKDGSIPKIQDLLNSGIPAAARNEFGQSALDLAAQNGRRDTVLFLLHDWKVNPNEIDKGGQTALHLAARHGHSDVVNLLLEYGANPNTQDKSKWTPLHRAAEGGHEDVANALCVGNANANENAKVNVNVNVNVKVKADPNVGGPNSMTPLMRAAQRGRGAMVKLLVGLGADAKLEDRYGKTAKDYAERGGWDDIWGWLP